MRAADSRAATRTASESGARSARPILARVNGARVFETAYAIEQRSSTTVLIGAGVRRELAARVAQLGPDGVFVVYDERLVREATELERLVDARASFAVHSGEASKTLAELARLSQALAVARASRRSVLVALGGGALCDLVGFLGAVHLRGLPVVLCPTTTLAACDAALGGKNGVDAGGLKNVLGTTRQPALVLCDTHWLATLPNELFREGLAEIVKKAAVLDAVRFERLEELAPALAERDDDALFEALAMAAEMKLAVVREDPFERDRRRWLNFGHTIGHALESSAGFALRHGQAVAIGMLLECRAAQSGCTERIERLLAALHLPTAPPRELCDVDALWELARSDKKAAFGSVPMVVPREIGSGHVVELTRAALAAALR